MKSIRNVFILLFLFLMFFSDYSGVVFALPEKPHALVTASQFLYVRSNYDYDSPSRGHMKAGDVFSVEIPEPKDDPHCCKILDGPFEGGYLYVKKIQYSERHFWIVRINDSGILIYTRPETKSPTMGSPKKGIAFAVENAPGGWFHILDGEFRGGYVYLLHPEFAESSDAAPEPTPPPPTTKHAVGLEENEEVKSPVQNTPRLNRIRLGAAFPLSDISQVLSSPCLTLAFFQDVSRWLPNFRVGENHWELGFSSYFFNGTGRALSNANLLLGSAWELPFFLPMSIAIRSGVGFMSTKREGGVDRSGWVQNSEVSYEIQFQEKINYLPNLDTFLSYIPDQAHSLWILGVAGSYRF